MDQSIMSSHYQLEGLGGYQEFDRYPEDHEETVYVDCPTCRGKGRINTSPGKDQLISLVPFSDERLKPKRTTLHVFITIGVVFLLTFLITFFIYPRSPELQLDPTVLHTIQPSSVNITTDAPTRVDFVFENRWNLYNPNYFSVTMVSFTVQVSLGSLLADIKNATHVTIPMKSYFTIHQLIPLTYKDDLAFMVSYCQDPRSWVHTSLMRFQATCITSSRDSNNTSVHESYQYVSCALPKPSTTPAPKTTTTTTKAKPTTPKLTTPKPITPKLTTPKPTTPKPTTPKPTTTEITTPEVTTPKPTTAEVTTTKVTTPKPTTTPKVTTPKLITPEVTTHKVSTPKSLAPEATTLKSSTNAKLSSTAPSALIPTSEKALAASTVSGTTQSVVKTTKQ